MGSGASLILSLCILIWMPNMTSSCSGPSVFSGSSDRPNAMTTLMIMSKVSFAICSGIAVKMSSTYLKMGIPVMLVKIAVMAAPTLSHP